MGWGVSTLTEKIQLEEIYDLMDVPGDVPTCILSSSGLVKKKF
jgi:hypothetical protein